MLLEASCAPGSLRSRQGAALRLGRLTQLTLALALCALAPLARAQTYPTRAITLVLPLTAGSAGDVALRVVAQKMAESLGQPIVVENQPGVSGLLGSERIARAPADGYLIGGIGDSVLNFAANLTPHPNFDPINGLDSIALVATIPWMLAVNPSLGPKSLAEFVALAKTQPGAINFASTGTGSASHIGMELFARQTGISLTHIPYKGANPGVIDVVGGQVPAVLSAVAVVLPFVKNGKLLALGVASDRRSELLPDVPTFTEAGVPFTFSTWVALFAPKGTPRVIIDRLNTESLKALADPAVRDKLLALGLEPQGSSPEQLAARVTSGHARVAKIIREAGIKLE